MFRNMTIEISIGETQSLMGVRYAKAFANLLLVLVSFSLVINFVIPMNMNSSLSNASFDSCSFFVTL